MPGTQSTLDPHLSRRPRGRHFGATHAGSSQPVISHGYPDSDSEGSEGLAAVRLSPEKKDRALLSTQDRRRVMDSDDEEAADRALDAEDEDDDGAEGEEEPEVIVVEDVPAPATSSRNTRSQQTQTRAKGRAQPAQSKEKGKAAEASRRSLRTTRAAVVSKPAPISRPDRATRAAKSQASLPVHVSRSAANRAYVELRSLSPAIKALYRYSDGTLHETPEPQASAELQATPSRPSLSEPSQVALASTTIVGEQGPPTPITGILEKTASPDKGKSRAENFDPDEPVTLPSPAADQAIGGPGSSMHLLRDEDEDEDDDLPGPSRRRLATAVGRDPDDSEDSDLPARAQKSKQRKAADAGKQSKKITNSGSKRGRPGRSSPESRKKPHQKRKKKDRYRDPDDSDNISAETEEEDMLAELQQDEPERFNSSTRLRTRPKETAMQRNIRKLANRRKGIEESTTPEESSEEDDSSESGTVFDSSSDDSEDFIVDDGGLVEDGLLPHEFSLNSAQTPEFKFKVVFQYFVLLVVKGPKILPLRGEAAEYMLPQLEDLRRKLKGWRDSRVRSQIWRAPLVSALQKYPQFIDSRLDYAHEYCDACNRHNYKSVYRVELKGKPYNRETFQALKTVSSESSEESDSSSSAEPSSKSPRVFISGSMCRRRTKAYHKLSHWEHNLWTMIRGWYTNMLRAKAVAVSSDSGSSAGEATDSDSDGMAERRRQRQRRRRRVEGEVIALKRKPLPKAHKDVDEVTQWMDTMMYTNTAWKWMEQLIKEGEQLDFAED